MLSINKIQLAFYTTFLIISSLNAQDNRPVRRCMSSMHEPVIQFRTTPYLSQAKIKQSYRTNTLNLPTVVHVVHTSSEGINTGNNISYEQVMSQINATNKDLLSENTNKTQTLAEFKSDVSVLNIELKMAIYDPNGNEIDEPGVNRIVGNPGTKGFYSDSEVTQIINDNIWDPNKYVNIWVLPLSTTYLGYAYFPDYPDLAGLDQLISSEIARPELDGVVISTVFFGSNEFEDFPLLDGPYDLGRTLTHELGHYLGILHIWGIGSESCSKDDFCDDTPKISKNHGSSANSTICSDDMISVSKYLCEEDVEKYESAQYQNFMDYTDDACMTMFSHDQKSRVDVIMENAPQRFTINAGAPSGSIQLTASNGDDFHTLSWEASDMSDATAFIVERQVENEGFEVISPALNLSTNSYNAFYDPSENSKKISYRVYMINENAFSFSSNHVSFEDGVVGIRPPSEASSFVVYPNPSDGIFTLEPSEYINQNAVLDVLSIHGSKILTKFIYDKNSPVSIDLSDQPRGTYIMLLKSDKGTYTQRCIKK
ncbi:M43 family zinc metalloprotease [Flammeovirga sp. OC4]|uniref:M43 family zinc metalloprotease n=1 Tax=Flammeovirga sp. OC4 TaxID=1382345 RepID=UPI0005C4A53C|nr:M43 family zinc metalloprotease [Flammeovirga sp. OC4]